jgi:perosamine synthetase
MIPLVKVAMPRRDVLMPKVEEILYSGMLAEGEAVYEFERRFQEHFRLPNTIAMSSGTAALHAALTLAGVQAGDEVISTPMTAEPTNTSILYSGGKVIWADVDPESGNIDPESVKKLISKKTKAIIAVHYAGYPARLRELRDIADQWGVALIEDCAHALGATYNGRPIGTIGHFGIYSFQAIKHITTVDGGALTVEDPSKVIEAKKFRWFGMLKGVPRTSVDITSIGYKYNMHNVAATIGLAQLETVDDLLEKHIDNGRYFDSVFTAASDIQFARVEVGAVSTYWLYTLMTDQSAAIERALVQAGVTASKLHRPNNLHSIFRESARELPNLEKFYSRLLHIPCGWWVSEEDRKMIAEVILQG